MITIDDIGSKISITNFVRTNEYIDKFLTDIVSEANCHNISACHLEMKWDNPDVFKEIKNQAKEIYEDSNNKIYEFYLGESLSISPLEMSNYKKRLILEYGQLTGRVYPFGKRDYCSKVKKVLEVNYNGKLYGVLDKNTIYSVEPIKWILL